MNEQRLPIKGLNCGSCVKRAQDAIAGVEGVTEVSVNLATQMADFTLQDNVELSAVTDAVRGAGYDVQIETVQFEITGMSCASCVKRVEDALTKVPSVQSASVNLANEVATVDVYAGSAIAPLTKAIRNVGYTVKLKKDGLNQDEQRRAEKDAEFRALLLRFIVAAVFTIPLFILEMGSHLIPGVHQLLMNTFGMGNLHLLYFVLSTVVLFGPGLIFFTKGVPALLRFAPEMNSLVVLGSTAAWTYSVVAVFAPSLLPAGTANIYFEASAVIITLILLGRVMEARAKGRTNEAITKLIQLQAKTAHVQRDGAFVEVDLDEVVTGDVLQVKPGEKVAVDGELSTGHSFIDESMISGEAIPVEKVVGSSVIGGTINGTGSFTFKVSKVGADTALAQIIRMVERAQVAKLPIQALVDKVTAIFVPAVMLAAASTFLIWLSFGPDPALSFALVNGVAVLIIACPCAMGLATPTSIVVGTGRAAELGILFRNGEALQGVKNTELVAVDKTGTLTLGRPVLTDLKVFSERDENEVLGLVAAAESQSEHPIAQAIVAEAQSRDIPLVRVDTFKSETGYGIEAKIGKHFVQVGADRYMSKLGFDPAAHKGLVDQLTAEAKTPMFVAIDGEIAALIGVADPIKETTAAAIGQLHQLGLRVAMISGDNQGTAEAIAKKLGIDEVYAEVLPAGKVDVIKELQSTGQHVSFVGDGINDAPALAQADVGIAIGTGTDIAIESADVVLMSGDMRGVASSIALSAATMKNIQQNLFWAFAYNVFLIPVAAGILWPINGTLLSPMLAAGAMALSSVFVLGNALRLKSFGANEKDLADAH